MSAMTWTLAFLTIWILGLIAGAMLFPDALVIVSVVGIALLAAVDIMLTRRNL